MKYIGKPNLHIIDYENNKEVFQFDNNGVYETTDDKIIKFMKEWKPFIKHEESGNTEPISLPDLNLEPNKQVIECKKCGEKFDNRGLFLAHCREKHPKK